MTKLRKFGSASTGQPTRSLRAFGTKTVQSASVAVPCRSLTELQAEREQIRKALYAAGWKPTMAYIPVTDEQQKRLLLALADVNRQITNQWA